MTTLQQPPVNEVVLSVAIVQQDMLTGPRLAEILGRWFSTYPDAQAMPPYEMPTEAPQSHQSPKTTFPALALVTSVPKLRYWLTSPQESFLIQIQPDYLALNWRRRDAASEYVHYQAIRDKFVELLRAINSGLRKRGGGLSPTRAELTYVNVIEPNALWSRPDEAHKLFAVNFSGSDDYEELSFAYTKSLRANGEWQGRLRATMNAGYDLLKDEPRLILSFTARSGSLPEQSETASLTFLDRAHAHINRTFLTLLKAEARELWGLSDHDG